MTPRQATPTDAPVIAAIWNAVIRDTAITFTSVEKTVEGVETMIAERGPAFQVASTQNRLMGFATYGPFRSGPGYAHTVESSVYLGDGFAGQGVAGKMMQALYDVAKSQDVTAMIACITASNAPAVRFHTSQGFERVGLLPRVGRKFGKQHDLVIMQKNL